MQNLDLFWENIAKDIRFDNNKKYCTLSNDNLINIKQIANEAPVENDRVMAICYNDCL